MVVIGIDPGYAIVGYGVIDTHDKNQLDVLDYGVIRTSKDEKMSDRLLLIEKGMNILIDKYKPDAIAIEELFFTTNQKTAIKVAQARGVIMVTGRKKCKRIYEYTPLQVKQALTGYGRADKKQIQAMVKQILKLKKIPRPDDAADALAIAITHIQTAKFLRYTEGK